ncbi:hypothetical protein GBF38_012977, partial [Nibea albiflora]
MPFDPPQLQEEHSQKAMEIFLSRPADCQSQNNSVNMVTVQ